MRGVLLVLGLMPVAVGTGSFASGSVAGGSGTGLVEVAVGTLAAGGTGGGTGSLTGEVDRLGTATEIGGPIGPGFLTAFRGLATTFGVSLAPMIGRGEAALAGAAIVAATPTVAS